MGRGSPTTADVAWPHRAFSWLALGVATFSLSELSLMTPFVEQGTALFWLASGLTMGVLINLPFGSWPGALGSIFLFCFASNLNHSIPLGLSVTFALANVIEPACGAALFSFWTENRRRSLVAQGVLLVAAGMIASSIGTIVGVGSLILSDAVARISRSLSLWYVADLLGIVLVAPFVMSWWPHSAWSAKLEKRRFSFEMALWAAVSLLVGCATFWQDMKTQEFSPLLYAQLGLLVFCALRLGARGASAVGLCVTAAAVSGTLAGHGPFTTANSNVVEQATNLQIYLVAITFAGLVPGLFVSQQTQLASGVSGESSSNFVKHAPESVRRARQLPSAPQQQEAPAAGEKKTPELARRAELQVVGDVAAGAAHDFNNILMAIQGSAQLLSFTAENEQKEILRDVLHACDAARRLTTRLTSLKDDDSVRFERVKLSEMLSDFHRTLSRVAGEKIQLELATPDENLKAYTDESQLGRYLCQLALLARHTIHSGGVITVGAKEDRANAEFVVIKWVCSASVASEQQTLRDAIECETEMTSAPLTEPPIFAPDSIRKRLGGRVQVADNTSTTIVELRLKTPEITASDATSSHPKDTTEGPSGIKILVVEDEAELRAPLLRLLSRKGFQPTLASDSEGALELLEKEVFDVVLTDLALPGMNGQQLRDEIRKVLPGLPVLFMSGSSDDSVAPRLQGPTTHQLLRKPFTAQELSDAISEALNNEL